MVAKPAADAKARIVAASAATPLHTMAAMSVANEFRSRSHAVAQRPVASPAHSRQGIGTICQAVRHSEQMPGALPMQQNASRAAAHSSGKVLSAAPSLFRIDAAS
jgi:hypothetical protein